MCTVVIQVPEADGAPVRLIAIRDEDPNRPWLALGAHWPKAHPGLVGVKDVRAGGAWLAARPEQGRFAVLLNVGAPTPEPGLASRGKVVVAEAEGEPADGWPRTAPFALLTVAGSRALLTVSDGEHPTTTPIPPGVHMFVNSPDMDDFTNPRVARWLPRFRAVPPPTRETLSPGPTGAPQPPLTGPHPTTAPTPETPLPGPPGTPHPPLTGPHPTTAPPTDPAAGTADTRWAAAWFAVLDESAQLPPTDDAALIRDNRPHGIPTLSLLLCTATVAPGAASIEYIGLGVPGDWATRQPPIHAR